MKRIALVAAVVVTAASGAFAQQATVPLSSAIQSQIAARVPGADLSNLTSKQYARLVALFSNSDDLRPGNDLTGAVTAILTSAQ